VPADLSEKMEKEGINVKKTMAEERYLKITPDDAHQFIASGIEVAR